MEWRGTEAEESFEGSLLTDLLTRGRTLDPFNPYLRPVSAV